MESSLLDGRLRDGGIPVDKHGNVVTFYGDYSSYQGAPGMEDTNLAYVFLLDKKGIVRWKGMGMQILSPKKNSLRL
jgi:hypothetical protein